MKRRALCAWLLLTLACKKEEGPPVVPEITLLSVAPTTVVQFGEEVQVRISYKDGDGDLGRVDADDFSIWVKDARLATADGYHVQPLAPIGSSVAIEGELTIVLRPLFLLGNGSEEATKYTLELQDRAGNWSNEVVTPEIIITSPE
jgi:hypothetical protein